MRRSLVGTGLLALLLTPAAILAPTAASAQTCGLVPGLVATGGYVSHRVAGGTSGTTAGADMTLGGAGLTVRLGYRRMFLEGDAADPDVLRGVAAYPVLRGGGAMVCARAHAGVTRFTLEADAGAVMAGGVGVTVTSGGDGWFHPYASVRGLGARTVGTVLGLDIDAAGLSLGVEAGASADLGPLSARLTGAYDGFDDGLGVTPYPATSLELALGVRF